MKTNFSLGDELQISQLLSQLISYKQKNKWKQEGRSLHSGKLAEQ
jgi:hypothetical protein